MDRYRWWCSGRSIPQTPDQAWTTHKQNDQNNMGGNWASSIAFASDGTAWLTMINGNASSYKDGNWQAFDEIYSFDAVAVDAQDQIWFADNYNGVLVLDNDGNQVMTFTTANGLPFRRCPVAGCRQERYGLDRHKARDW